MPESGRDRNWLLYALPFFILAAALRFWDFGNMPFTNDELSAWNRLNHPDLHSLIKLGIEPDAHPALTQVFLWIWTSAFGDAEWVVKLPFVLMSLGAFLICFQLAYRIYGRGAAMLTGVLLAGSQVVLVFSTVARPYASGMLICAALVWYWYRIVFEGSQKYSTHLLFAVTISLSVYNHYFSGLMGIMVWFSGLLYWRKLDLKKYLGSALLALILFLPHLPTSLIQVSRGGIGGADGWLAKPKPDFAMEWWLSLFNYNWILTIAGSLLLLFSIISAIRSKSSANKAGVHFTTWFVLILAISYTYSHFVNPLLHHGTIFFATPFLIVAITGSLPANKFSYLFGMGFTILLLWSLVTERKHFDVAYRQPYARTAAHLSDLSGKSGKIFALIHQEPQYMAYYLHSDTLPYAALNTHQKNYTVADEIRAMLHNDADVFYTDGRNGALVYAAHLIYPNYTRYEGFLFSGFHFRKEGALEQPLYHTLSANTDTLITQAEFVDVLTLDLTAGNVSFGDEIGAAVRFAEKPANDDVHLVFDLRKNGESIHWSSGKPSNNEYMHNHEFHIVHQLLLWDTFTAPKQMNGAELKIYIWNPGKTTIKINGGRADKLEANPNYYGLLTRRP
jgi:hypothetical protein